MANDPKRKHCQNTIWNLEKQLTNNNSKETSNERNKCWTTDTDKMKIANKQRLIDNTPPPRAESIKLFSIKIKISKCQRGLKNKVKVTKL